jgi:hypothetical protein
MLTTINHLYRHSEGIEIDCELDYEPGYRETDIDPAWPASAYILSAKVGGVDILPLLSERMVKAIEEAAVWEQS